MFVKIYKLNQWEAGLIYLPFGIGGACSALLSGRMLDRSWDRSRRENNIRTDKAVGDDLDIFPIEKARLRVIWAPMLLTACLVIGFGWALHYQTVCTIFLMLAIAFYLH
jgi:MFS family permease